ncbi:hypothetical protein LCL97_21815 [Seohaeicola saemankumensis]|nr:hypothetical protein [Seohaeicola saemankumensis]MCA0873477.1 hypothetical protein [Seohaeicola saemankumensis]
MSRKYLMVGMSHIQCLKAALREDEAAQVEIVNLKQNKDLWSRQTAKIKTGRFKTRDPDVVCICIGGNEHNQLGLLDHPEPIAVGSAELGLAPGADDAAPRQLIPRAVMRDAMKAMMHKHDQMTAQLHADFPNARFIHLSSPPPIADGDHVLGNLGIFKDKLHSGIGPVTLRKTLYDLQVELTREQAEALGAEFLPAAPGALTEDGFLKDGFYNNDPSHGNAAYGRLMLDRIFERETA